MVQVHPVIMFCCTSNNYIPHHSEARSALCENVYHLLPMTAHRHRFPGVKGRHSAGSLDHQLEACYFSKSCQSYPKSTHKIPSMYLCILPFETQRGKSYSYLTLSANMSTVGGLGSWKAANNISLFGTSSRCKISVFEL